MLMVLLVRCPESPSGALLSLAFIGTAFLPQIVVEVYTNTRVLVGECKTDLESSNSDGLGYRETLLLFLLSWRLTLYFLGLLMKFCGQQPPGFVTFRVRLGRGVIVSS